MLSGIGPQVSFDRRPTVLALEVKVYWGHALFFSNLTFFYNRFRTIGHRAKKLTPSCFLVKKNRMMPNFSQNSFSKFDLWPHFGSQVRPGQI